jgi:aspartyl protease family protein
MAPTYKFLLVVVVLLIPGVFVANATQPSAARTLRVPVFFRNTANRLRYPLDADADMALACVDDPTLRSPAQSGVAHDSGEYFAALGVGTPSTRAFLIIDTGSDFTWLQCAPCRRCQAQMTRLYDPRRSSSYSPVPFSAARCRELKFPVRDARTGGCMYTVVYADGTSSRGEVAADRLVFSDDTHQAAGNVTIGCGRDNAGLLGSAAGVLGIGRGPLAFPVQLAAEYGRVFSYCLGDRESRATSSYLVFGRSPEPLAAVFTPLRASPRNPSQYYVDMVGFSVDGSRVAGFPGADLALDLATGQGGVVVDSGTTVSSFAWDTYAALRDAFDARAAAAGMRNVRRNISLYDTCYDLQGTTARVPTVVLHLAGSADMVLPTKNYLVLVDFEGRTYHCFGFRGFKPADGERNTLGNVQQQGFQIVFDVERERVGFVPNGCSG